MTLYEWALRWAAPVFRAVLRVRAADAQNVPAQGALVLCANHRSNLDPVLLSVAFPRPMRYMAKAELFRIPLFSRLITALGAFPVHRGANDREAIKTALSVLQSGEVLGMFPEGHRNRGAGLMRFRSGALRLAAQTRAPLLPAVIVRLGRWPFGRVEVHFGPPVSPQALGYDEKEPESLHAATDALRSQMLALLEGKTQ